jgi:uncharacterized membrane protein
MGILLVAHIVAGLFGLLFGYVALFSAKGQATHRRSGMLFVYVMLPMAFTGMVISAVGGVARPINIPAAMVTFYLVLTALLTVRRFDARPRWVDVSAMVAAFSIGVASVPLGMMVIAQGGRQAGMAYPLFMFGAIAFMSALGDRRMIRAGGLTGAPRLRRHLWRMCVALFVAAGSFFLGQADEFPEALRVTPLLALPVLTVLATMFYWLWRTRAASRRPAAVAPRAQPASGFEVVNQRAL